MLLVFRQIFYITSCNDMVRFCVLNKYKVCALIAQKIDHTSRQKLIQFIG